MKRIIIVKMKKVIIAVSFLFGFSLVGKTQEYTLTLEKAIELGLQNHQQLKISEAKTDVSKQQLKVAKNQMLPSVEISANAFYLGDVMLLNTDWSKLQTIDMPNFGNTFGVQASQLLYKGGVIRESIKIAKLQIQLAELDRVSNEQEIKFLIISNYLDIQKLINQIHVLEANKILAEQILDNITKLYEQEMVTRNELIRSELQIKNLEQTILSMKHGHAILSNQLSYALGLPNDVLLIPEENKPLGVVLQPQNYYMNVAYQQHSALQMVAKNVEIAEKNVDIQKTNWFPVLSAFGGYNMQRPLTSSMPPMDLYNNSWQVGLNLTFHLDDLYKNKQHVDVSKSEARVAQESALLVRQNIEINVNAAFLKCQEAEQQTILMYETKNLANENYEIVQAKYLNQLAIMAEMTDASNAKLNAELQFVNAIINAQFQYYSLLKSTGTL